MPERVTRIYMRAFRGVPGELTIELPGGRSLLVQGDNGTGKSSIADALEFFFGGEISSLCREGRGIIHNVGSGSDQTTIEIDTTGSLGGRATPNQGSPSTNRLVSQETYILRGKTLAEFIDQTKGEKWRSLCDILGMGQVDQVRLDLQQARNALASELTSSQTRCDAAARALKDLCPNLTEEVLLQTIRETCERAGVKPPLSLEIALRQDWADSVSERAKLVNRATQLKLIAANFKASPPFPKLAFVEAWNNVIGSMKGIERSRAKLLEAAGEFLVESPRIESCPLCGGQVDDRSLRERISSLLDEIAKWSRALDGAGRQLQGFIDTLVVGREHRAGLRDQALKLGVQLPELPGSVVENLRQCLSRTTSVELVGLVEARQELSNWDAAVIEQARQSMPGVRPEDEALVRLLQLVHLGKSWITEKSVFLSAQRAVQFADRLHDEYLRRQTVFFSQVLERTSERVAAIYARLHPDEEISNVAVETWGDKGVELALDFHGQRHRPPHAVLSESHLNSLGIALFLAMSETFNEHLGFLVLDDVVNSFDLQHRGRLAELLADEFEAWQFIVLTHDQIFFEHFRRRAPQSQVLEFTSWSYEEGPRAIGYEAGSLLEKAWERLGADDVQGAATKGRRALEEILQEACEGMEAPLSFRRGFRNDRREAQELITGARRGLKSHRAYGDDLKELLLSIEADLQTTFNVESHAGTSWSSLAEVKTSLERLAQLDSRWTCAACQTKVWVFGQPGSTRCRCGQTTFPPG